MSNSHIFLQSDLYHSLDGGAFPRPASCPLTNAAEDTLNIPYYLVGDEAFALKDYLMKPFPRGRLDARQGVFNYRLSRARRIIENSFGILAMRFRIFLTAMELRPNTALLVIKVSVLLHNLLMRRQQLPPTAFDR